MQGSQSLPPQKSIPAAALNFNELLQQCPSEYRDNIRYFTVDESGDIAGHFQRPIRKEKHWDAPGPYWPVGILSNGTIDWRTSLMRRPLSMAQRWILAAAALVIVLIVSII